MCVSVATDTSCTCPAPLQARPSISCLWSERLILFIDISRVRMMYAKNITKEHFEPSLHRKKRVFNLVCGILRGPAADPEGRSQAHAHTGASSCSGLNKHHFRFKPATDGWSRVFIAGIAMMVTPIFLTDTLLINPNYRIKQQTLSVCNNQRKQEN